MPKLLIRIKQENRWLKRLLKQQPVDAILSDNRFGLYSPKAPSVFLTHQLGVKTGLGKLADVITQQLNYRFINHFTTCWVPDYKDPHAIAGQLSNPARLPAIPVHYTGGVSRFNPCTSTLQKTGLLIILSGPEPQRSIFETILLHQLNEYAGKATVVRGLPGNHPPVEAPAHIAIHNHVSAEALNELMCAAEIVISRTGYTTVMDLLKLGKRSILVPTPGQPEQEYLAQYLNSRHLAFCVPQKNFLLKKLLEEVNTFPFSFKQYSMEEYTIIVSDFVRSLRS